MVQYHKYFIIQKSGYRYDFVQCKDLSFFTVKVKKGKRIMSHLYMKMKIQLKPRNKHIQITMPIRTIKETNVPDLKKIPKKIGK